MIKTSRASCARAVGQGAGAAGRVGFIAMGDLPRRMMPFESVCVTLSPRYRAQKQRGGCKCFVDLACVK